MIELIMGLFMYIIPLYSLMFALYFLIGSLNKTIISLKIVSYAIVCLSLLALFIAGSGFQFCIALFGYILGCNIRIQETTGKNVLKYCLIVSLGVAAFDIIYYSGLYDFRFLRYPSFLFDPRLVYYLPVGILLTSFGVAAIYSVLFFAFTAVARINKINIAILVLVMHILESKMHENIYHPFWIHHPTITTVTLAMFILGWRLSSSGVFNWINERNTRLEFWKASTLYFILYHAIIEIYEKIPGAMFDIDYLMACMLVSTFTLIFGAYCGKLGETAQSSA